MNTEGTDLLRTSPRTFRRTMVRTVAEPSLYLDFTASNALDPRITFSRGSQATLFDSTGTLKYAKHNLLQRSQALATSPWFNSGLTSIANDTTDVIDPAGGNNASKLVVAASAGVAGQSAGTLTANLTYVGSVWLRCQTGTVSGSLIVYLGVAPFTNIGTQSITITTTWQRFTVTTSAATAATYNFQIHNLSGGTVYAYGAQFNLTNMEGGVTSSLTTYYPTTTAAYYAPRFTYNPTTLAPQGLLIEEQRANLASYSEDATQWGTGSNMNPTLANQAIAPDGLQTADKLVENTANATHFLSQTSITTTYTSGTAYTKTVFLKQAGRIYASVFLPATNFPSTGRTAVFDLQTGTIISTESGVTSSIENCGNGWYRCRITATATSTGSGHVGGNALGDSPSMTAYTGDGTSGIFVWGAQLEAGAFPTSYIPTTTTALTRNADVTSMTGTNFSSWFNAAEGTLYVEGVGVNNIAGATRRYAEINDGTASERFVFGYSATNSTRYLVTDISTQADVIASVNSGGVLIKMAAAYKIDDFQQASNGTLGTADTSGTLPTVDRMFIGFDPNTGSSTYLNGTIRSIRYYPVRLANAQLQALTA